MKKTQILTPVALWLLSASMWAGKPATASGNAQAPEEMVAYLFTYFNSNAPEDEQICYALSDDGFNYTPLNQGWPVIESDTIALTQCVRDPHILRCEDGKTFYMVVTDMRSSLGWASNRGMVLLKSDDLIHWQHSAINFPTRYTKTWKNVIRVWAPETIYDRKAGKYMVFYSLRTSDPDSYDKIYYQYANADFTDLEGEPKWLFDAGNATIDGQRHEITGHYTADDRSQLVIDEAVRQRDVSPFHIELHAVKDGYEGTFTTAGERLAISLTRK